MFLKIDPFSYHYSMSQGLIEPTGEKRRHRRIVRLIKEIGKQGLLPLAAEAYRDDSQGYPDHSAIDELVAGYNHGDIDIDTVLAYYKVVSPYVTTDQLPVREVDKEAFKKIAIGEVVLVNNEIQVVQGKDVVLDTDSLVRLREDEGFTLAVRFDITPDRPYADRRDVTVSLHHLADNLFAGADNISKHLSELDPTALSEDDWKRIDGANVFRYGEAHRASDNLTLLRSITTHDDIAKQNPEAIQKLKDAAVANTKFVLGLDTEKASGMRVYDRRFSSSWDSECHIARRFVDTVREFDPAAYEEMLDSIGVLVASDPAAKSVDGYVRFIAWVNQPAEKRTKSTDEVNIAEIVPVFNDLIQRGSLAS